MGGCKSSIQAAIFEEVTIVNSNCVCHNYI